jgi:hypothetical protein
MFWTLVQGGFSKSAKIGFFHKNAPTKTDKKTTPRNPALRKIRMRSKKDLQSQAARDTIKTRKARIENPTHKQGGTHARAGTL